MLFHDIDTLEQFLAPARPRPVVALNEERDQEAAAGKVAVAGPSAETEAAADQAARTAADQAARTAADLAARTAADLAARTATGQAARAVAGQASAGAALHL